MIDRKLREEIRELLDSLRKVDAVKKWRAFGEIIETADSPRRAPAPASDLTSMPVLVKLRAQELEPSADAAIAATRDRVVELLKPGGGGEEPAAGGARLGLAEIHGSEAMEVLARRLDHIEHTARKVARLAARPVLENI